MCVDVATSCYTFVHSLTNRYVFDNIKNVFDLEKNILLILLIFFYKQILQYNLYNLIYLFDLIICKKIIRNCKVNFNFIFLKYYNLEFVCKFEIAIQDYLN